MATTRLVFMVLAALTAQGCAHNICSGDAVGWRKARSAHFSILSDALTPRIETTASLLERHYAEQTVSFFGGREAKDIPVVLFDDETEFVDRFGYNRFNCTLEPGAKRPTPVIALRLDTPDEGVAHALAHHLVRLHLPKAPVWFAEAFATYVETASTYNDTARFGAWPRRVVGATGGHLVPLAELWKATWADYNGDRRGRFVDAGWAFLYFLLHAHRNEYRAAFPAFVTALASGRDTRDAMAVAYPALLAAETQDSFDRFARVELRGTPGTLQFPITPIPSAALDVAAATPAETSAACASIESLTDADREGWPDWN